MTKIVIVGAGFGGLQAALRLEKKFKGDKRISLTLVDRRDYQLFTPNLYEVATAEEELTSLVQLKKSIALPLREVLANKAVNFRQGELVAIDTRAQRITVGRGELEYDYLVLSLGSVPNCFDIEGAAQYALPLKSLADAFRVRNAIEFAVQARRLDRIKQTIRFAVVGGGYTGVELAGELPGLLDIVAWKNSYPRERLEILMLEAGSSLVPGFDDRLSRDVFFRLKDLGVRVELGRRLARVGEHFLEFYGEEKLSYDVLIWTAGVKAAPLPLAGGHYIPLDAKGRVELNEYLQIKSLHNVFVIGDLGCVLDHEGKPQPGTAQNAIDQGAYVAYALPQFLNNRRPRPYDCLKHGFIVNAGGKWAVLCIGKFYFTGFWAYVVDKLAHLGYYRSVVGFWKALRYVFREVKIYSRND